jgi:sarcosine oxidase delta subunit
VLGCRQWIVLERSTATNHTVASRAARQVAPTREAISLGDTVTK